MREREHARRRVFATDLVTAEALSCFGARVNGEAAPFFFELGDSESETSLYRTVRARIGARSDTATFERDFTEITGITLARFLDAELCERLVSRMRRRPVLWKLASRTEKRRRALFTCVVHAHSVNAGALLAIADRARVKTRGLPPASIAELDRFAGALANVAEHGFDSADAKAAYAPHVDDGVRVNIAPLQRAGLLALDVLTAADVERAIVDRARWRSGAPTV